jgi:hypothetical protein
MKPNPIGVLLDTEEIDALNIMSDDLDISRHQILQYAIRKVISDYKNGKYPMIIINASKGLENPLKRKSKK